MSEDLQRSIAVFLSTLLISSTVAYLWVTPRPKEQFYQLYVLGEKRMIADYYPGGNSTLSPNTPVQWYLGVTNFMGSAECAVVKVKLGNHSTSPPDSVNCTPAPLPTLREFRRVLLDNETWEIPFLWRVSGSWEVGDMAYVELNIDGAPVEAEVGAVNGSRFRLIFELWSFSEGEGDFIFGWRSGEERRAAWNQLWFNVTSPG